MKAAVGVSPCPMEGLPPPESRHVVLTKLEASEYVLRVPRGGKSAVWKIFLHVLTLGGQKVDFVLCRYCCGLFMYKGYASGTSSLMNHGIRCLDRPKRPDEGADGGNVLIHEDWPEAFKEQPYFSLGFLKRYKQGDRRPPSPCLPLKYSVHFKVEPPAHSLDGPRGLHSPETHFLASKHTNNNNNKTTSNKNEAQVTTKTEQTTGLCGTPPKPPKTTLPNPRNGTAPHHPHNNQHNHKLLREHGSPHEKGGRGGAVPHEAHTIPLYTALHVAAQSFGLPLDVLLRLADGVVGGGSQRSMLQDDQTELSSGGGSVGLSGIEAVVAAAAAAAAAAGDPTTPSNGGAPTAGDGQMMLGSATGTSGNVGRDTQQGVGLSPPSVTSPSKPESYQLRHNNHLSLVLNQLAEDEAFMDVTLTAEGRPVKAHKSVLSAVSPYFSSVLRANPCQHPIIIMPHDVSHAQLANIIMYIYKGEMTVSAEELPALLKTAELLRITGLSPGENSSSHPPLGRASVTASSFAGLFNGSVNPPAAPIYTSASETVRLPSPPPRLDNPPQQAAKKTNSGTPAKALPVRMESPPPEPTMLNPSDFMDLDMTCVKEEMNSDCEEEEDAPKSPTPKEVTTPPPVENPLSSDSRDRLHSDRRSDPDDPDSARPSLEAACDDADPPHRPPPRQSSASPSGHCDDSDADIKRNSLKTLANLASLDTPTNLSPCEDSGADTSDAQPNVCPYCSEYVAGGEVASHMSSKHAFKPAFVCTGCQRVFTRKTAHELHAKDCKKET